MTDPVRGYDERAAVFVHQYEQLDPESVHGSFLDCLPEGADRLALDIGAGSGRDAAWLRRKGFEVVAVEPSPGMRIAGQSLHPRAKRRPDRLESRLAGTRGRDLDNLCPVPARRRGRRPAPAPGIILNDDIPHLGHILQGYRVAGRIPLVASPGQQFQIGDVSIIGAVQGHQGRATDQGLRGDHPVKQLAP